MVTKTVSVELTCVCYYCQAAGTHVQRLQHATAADQLDQSQVLSQVHGLKKMSLMLCRCEAFDVLDSAEERT